LTEPTTEVSIRAEPFDSPEAQRLILALDAGLAERYTPDQRFGPTLKPEQVTEGRGRFVIARDRGRAVGCGAIRVLDSSTAEIKRMYVDPAMRGKGIGRLVLGHLEAAARQLGVTRLVLETGVYQDAAIRLYRREGFHELDCWGEYAASRTSVCFQKRL